MGRPKKAPEDVKDKQIKVLFTDEELKALKTKHLAINKKLSFNEFLREMIDQGIALEQEKKREIALRNNLARLHYNKVSIT